MDFIYRGRIGHLEDLILTRSNLREHREALSGAYSFEDLSGEYSFKDFGRLS